MLLRLTLLAACLALAACGDSGAVMTDASNGSAPGTAMAATSATAPAPTALVLDWYGQIRGDACERLATGDDSQDDGAPAGATSPLNAGPPAPEDEPARPALDLLPVPTSWTQIDERTTSSIDEPWAHGIQRTWCVPGTATAADVDVVLGWVRAHRDLGGDGGVPVLVEATFSKAWGMLYARARLHPPSMDVRSLAVRVRWADGALPGADAGTPASPEGAAIELHLDCAPSGTLAVVSDTRPQSTAPPSAAAICATVAASPGLLLEGATRVDCRASADARLVVDITGTWDGAPIALHRESCDASQPSTARQWVETLRLDALPD